MKLKIYNLYNYVAILMSTAKAHACFSLVACANLCMYRTLTKFGKTYRVHTSDFYNIDSVA